MVRKLLADLLALVVLVGLVCVFYYPERNPLQSRYMYRADTFERSAHLINPDYDNEFQMPRKHRWESYCPFSVLWARCFVLMSPDDLGRAVVLGHMVLVLVAAAGTFLSCRLFLSTPVSFLVSGFMLCGRVLLPLARGLGMTQIHLLVPLSLVFVAALPHLFASGPITRRRWAWIVAASASLACAYALGSHETVYAAACLGAATIVGIGLWAGRSFRARRVLPVLPKAAVISLILAAPMGVGVMTLVQRSIPRRMGREPLGEMLSYSNFIRNVARDAKAEPLKSLSAKLEVHRATFVEGRYLGHFGEHHQNVFLHPGEGFNGVFPIFLVPGLVVGVACFVRRASSVWSGSRAGVDERARFFLAFLLLLLLMFVAALAMTYDPKPTRYTYSIFALYVLAALGYERLAKPIGRGVSTLIGRLVVSERFSLVAGKLSRLVIWVVVLTLGAFRMGKNHRDLRTYFDEFAHQVPTIAHESILARAEREVAAGKQVAIYSPHRRYIRHPSVGMWRRFRPFSHIRIVYTKQELANLPSVVKVIRGGPDVPPSYAYHGFPRSRWADVPAAIKRKTEERKRRAAEKKRRREATRRKKT